MPKKTVLLKRILLGLAAIAVVFVGVVASRPNAYRIERSATVAAPASSVFAHVNDFHQWAEWSPWESLDPSMKKTFEGSPAGTGAIYSWDGNDKVGAGRMTLLESRPDERIRIKLEFFRPMQDACATEFAFKPRENQTAVTWSMTGEHTFISKAVCLFMDLDKMVGGDFERGLARLKTVVESAGSKVTSTSRVSEISR